MFDVLSHSDFSASRTICDSVHSDRTQQFVVRHGWQLQLDSNGVEVDEFDCPDTTYCVVHDAGRHLASLRLRHPRDGSLAQKAFPDVWEQNRDDLENALEVTRLCTAPGLPEAERRLAFVELLIGLNRYGMKAGQPILFGAVYPGVARAIAKAGWESDVLTKFDTDGRTTFIALWKCSALVDWSLQERAERLSEIVRKSDASLVHAA